MFCSPVRVLEWEWGGSGGEFRVGKSICLEENSSSLRVQSTLQSAACQSTLFGKEHIERSPSYSIVLYVMLHSAALQSTSPNTSLQFTPFTKEHIKQSLTPFPYPHLLTSSFIGTINQVVPSYSAIKFNGCRLSDMAREGIPTVSKSRPVRIDSIDVVDVVPSVFPEVTLRVQCGSGTYVRSLCRDLAHVFRCSSSSS